MANKVEQALASVRLAACRYGDSDMDVALDALIAAVRADEREAVLREKGYNVIRISGEVGQ